MVNWALAVKPNMNSQWYWPPRRAPTKSKVWRDCLRGTFMKGVNDLLEPVTETQPNCYGHITFRQFNYSGMTKGSSLMDTLGQYLSEFLSLLGRLT